MGDLYFLHTVVFLVVCSLSTFGAGATIWGIPGIPRIAGDFRVAVGGSHLESPVSRFKSLADQTSGQKSRESSSLFDQLVPTLTWQEQLNGSEATGTLRNIFQFPFWIIRYGG